MSHLRAFFDRKTLLSIGLLLCFFQASGAWALSSYAIGATDEIGSTGSASVGLGVPDYGFTNDLGIGLAGNTDVFDVGEVSTFSFSTPLRAIAGQHDLVLSAYVGGLGETDNAQVQVEVSSDGIIFTLAATFDTEEARDRPQDRQENDHSGVKHFWIDFNGADDVTHVRLSNLAGTSEGLRLDSIEGLHPSVDANHAFEIRFERYRVDASERFLIRLKNLSDEMTGQPITGFSLEKLPVNEWMEDTTHSLLASDGIGEMICVENCVGDADLIPGVHHATWAFSLDGISPAPAGTGLEPGRHGAHERFRNIDIDAGGPYLSGFTFTVEFADGLIHTFTYDDDVLINVGQLYQKYTYFSATPSLSGPRQVDYYEWRNRSTVTFSNPASVGDGHAPGVGGRLFATSQNFVEDGLHVESFWVPNDTPDFVQGHFHDLEEGYERSHGFESTPGLGPDRQGIYLERVDGGAFDLESLDYRLGGILTATSILISPTYDPSLPITGQFTEFAVVDNPDFETLAFSQFEGVTALFVLPAITENQSERVDWDDFVVATADPITIAPTADAGPDLEITDSDDDGLETASLDGNASSDPDGSLASWTWLENGNEIGTGALTDVAFTLGRHDVTLQVLDDDGNLGSDDLQVQINPAGGLPFANAGVNQNVTETGGGSASVTLDASGSFDSNGAIIAWEWSEAGVPLGSGEFLGLSLSVGTHFIDLLVTDDSTNTATDSVTLSVTPLGGFPPIANAGVDLTATDIDTDGLETVTLDGSASSDPDGTITSWDWSEAGQPLGSGETLPVGFSVGVHSVDLVVTDDAGLTAVDSLTVTVDSGVVVQPPAYIAHETSAETSNATSHILGVATLPIVAGDLLVAHICSDGGGGMALTCPVGWTELEKGPHTSSGVYGAVCFKQADLSDETATSYEATTTIAQQSQSGVILIENQDPTAPIEMSIMRNTENDTSPESPALPIAPLPSSRVLRFMCANAGQVSEGVGFPAGMTNNLWVEESNDGFSGPASGGAAIDTLGVSDAAEWTGALASNQQSVSFSVAIAGRAAVLTADAGADQSVTDVDQDGFETRLLDGSGSSDFDGLIVDWRWSEGGSAMGSGETLSLPFAVGIHDIDLEVEDDEGNLATDSLQITVHPGGLIPPTADAGPDQSVTDDDLNGTEFVTLDGSGSFDTDGTVDSWTWSEGGAPLASGAMPLVELAIGTHTIDLIVVDDDGNPAFDDVVISVQDGGIPPVANAGSDQSVVDTDDNGSQAVTLDASASSDPDGSIVRWTWSEGGSPLGSGETLEATFAVGTHAVDLEIEDDDGLLSTDSVSITVSVPGASVPALFLGFETSEEVSNTATHALNVGTLPIANGDLMVAQLCVDGGGGTTVSCPTGWAEIRNIRSRGGALRAALCTREASSADESVTSYEFTTSVPQQTQSGVYLFAGHDTTMPIELSAARSTASVSPDSPAFASAPASSSTILRMMCANTGQVSEGIGFPTGMANDLWLLESNDGSSGPVAGGASIDALGASGSAVWTNALASSQQNIGFSVAIAGGDGAPIANAGPDATLVDSDEDGFENILLDASDSFDPNGSIVSWSWSEGGMPLGTGETLSLPFLVGAHVVDLEVEDGEGNLASDSVEYILLPGGAVPPVADAGSDVSIIDVDEDGFESVLLDGSASFDSDGFITSWTWSEGAALLGTGETVAVLFDVGTHAVELSVEDDDGNTDLATVTITVSPGGGVSYVAHETSSESSNTTSHTLSVGTLPIAAGDLMVAHICVDGGGSTTLSCPTDWTELVTATHQSSGVLGGLCTKQADVSDESTTSYSFATTINQQSQSGVILIEGHDAASPIAELNTSTRERSDSPVSPALDNVPAENSLVMRFTCSNSGQITEGVGFPSGMASELWLLESADGGSGPVSGGAAIDVPTASSAATWTSLLSSPQQSVTFSLSIGADGS
ncbi:MAG: hypothetical protein CL933_24060 [Deltaproteobacteria bacterium]|nr:hypothetical protein [Deltaproteobacteria bacterium]